ncbi:hypothetical protein HCN44_007523 [Aphidius gifuensis]|uniref:Uncharacterized protein n=1 Tax=Aphidius gifuensis TaxID=684658 RepID=A0A834XMI6_APHGI|nr:hypothetical protein HCN44_007523 [Aphidius gifuensis]
MRCPAQSICHPRGSRLERVSTLQGVKIIETVDTCDCWSSQLKCTIIRCPAQSICHPRGSRLERVSTLQGVKIIETVDTCDCWSSQSKYTIF